MSGNRRTGNGRPLALLALLACLLGVCAGAGDAATTEGSPPAPLLTASGGEVQWASVGLDESYELALSNEPSGTGGRRVRYVLVAAGAGPIQSYAPVLAPGRVLYVEVSADGGASWSPAVALSGAPRQRRTGGQALPRGSEPAEQPEAPTGSPQEQTGAPGVRGERPQNKPAKKPKKVKAKKHKKHKKKKHEKPPPPPPPPPPTGTIIGTDDGSGWGPAPASTLIRAGITWTRDEVGSDSISASLQEGFKVLAIVANINDRQPLSQVQASQWGAEAVAELRQYPGISIAEAGNEMYLKGGIAEPVQYGRLYMAAINAMHAANIHTPLLFNMFGDYPRGGWSSPSSWSRDSSGGGWLRDAVNGVPGLASAILANGVAIHPYGTVGENNDDDYGVNAAAADESVAHAVLGSIPRFYITEFGYDLSSCGRDLGACSEAEQASKLRAAYKVFLADPHISGIWWYQSHDDSTGRFGLMNNNNSTRPSFTALSSIAKEMGQ